MQAESASVLPVTLRKRLLGELLVAAGLVTQADVQKALAFQTQFGGRLGSVLVRLGALSEDNLLPVLSEQLGIDMLAGSEWPAAGGDVRATLLQAGGNLDWWVHNGVVAWRADAGRVLAVARDPLDPALNEALDRAYEGQWSWRLVKAQDADRLIDMVSSGRSGDEFDVDDDVGLLRELAEEAPVIELVNNILAQAMDQRASDIHIEPEESMFHVRMRTDGILHTKMTLAASRYPAVASRVKLISGMDIAERRLPQDGRLSVRVSGQEVDVRVSAVPAVHGESLVMRLLPKERSDLKLDSLGFSEKDLSLFRKWVAEPHGVVLVTGPTGSGKSTSLYAVLEEINQLNQRNRKIITVEDPVEYEVQGVTQIQANSDIGYTFARALRAILRQDPDVIMIGEIRDVETAEIAVQSSLTGHLVLSTLHTNDAVSAFTRLVDMGVEPFLVATSVRAVQAQRLVRRLCSHCSEPTTVLPVFEDLVRAHLPEGRGIAWRRAVGCKQCQGTGYRGRLGIYELVDVTPELQELVISGATAEKMRALATQQGGRTLRDDGLLKACAGLTTVEEIVRVTGGVAGDE
jgi:general secretion pathway protein E